MSKDFVEMTIGNAGIDEIGEDIARADGGELIRVADEDEFRRGGECAQKLVREHEIEHARFIDDERVDVDGVLGVVLGFFTGSDADESVEGRGVASGRFGEPFGGASRGCGEEHGLSEALLVFGHEFRDRGLARTGSAREDEYARLDALDEGVLCPSEKVIS